MDVYCNKNSNHTEKGRLKEYILPLRGSGVLLTIPGDLQIRYINIYISTVSPKIMVGPIWHECLLLIYIYT